MITVRLTDAAQCVLSLDDPEGLMARGLMRADGRDFSGSSAALARLAEEFEAVASGLLCDATDNPGATKRSAACAARHIRAALASKH